MQELRLDYAHETGRSTKMDEEVSKDGEGSALDLLVAIAENLRLLILGPIIAGLMALGIAYIVPQSFTSQAILAMPMQMPTQSQTLPATPTPNQVAAMMVSPIVLDSVIESLKLSSGASIQVARMRLASQIKSTVGKDALLRLDVTANTPLDAQAIANAVIDTWLKSTVPGKQDRADLEKRLEFAKASLDSVNRLLERLTTDSGAKLTGALVRGEDGTTIVAMGELQTRYLGDVLNIPRALRGVSRDVVVQPPTLPTEPVAPKKGLIAILTVLCSGILLTIWVFMRQTWKIAAQDPAIAAKQARLRAAIGFR